MAPPIAKWMFDDTMILRRKNTLITGTPAPQPLLARLKAVFAPE